MTAPEDEATLAGAADRQVRRLRGAGPLQPSPAYALLVLRQNIYTDPQKPIQVQPGLYEINNPKPDSPLMVTTNFSITYFSVANEVESAGLPGWLLVADAEGMSVLTAWAAGKFDAEHDRQGRQEQRRGGQTQPSPDHHSRAGGCALRRAGGRAARLGDQGRAARGGGSAGVFEVEVIGVVHSAIAGGI